MQGHAAPVPRTRLTEEEWASLPEDERGELVDGVLEEEEMPDWEHEAVVVWLAQMLRSWIAPRGGFVAGSEVKYVLGKGRGRKPDLSLFLPGGAAPRRRGALRRPPDLAVEIVSSRPRDVRRDRVEKLAEYAAFGVRFYWIVDPGARTFEAYRLLADGRYVRATGVDLGPEFDGLVLDFDELWTELDRLGPEEPEPGV